MVVGLPLAYGGLLRSGRLCDSRLDAFYHVEAGWTPICPPPVAQGAVLPRHDYIFVDESGDPGYAMDPDSGDLLSSSYYVATVLHLCDDAFRDLNSHVAAFRYYSGLNRELKIPSQKVEFTRLIDPIRALTEGGRNIWASVVYVDKVRYTGSYLKPGGERPASTFRFRNYILRRLLEHHFLRYPLQSQQYDLVLDRVDLSREDAENFSSTSPETGTSRPRRT